MPSMMAPTVVMLADRRSRRSPIGGEVELVLGSAGSNRIRSALLQTIVGVVDRGLSAPEAVSAPRAHFERGIVYHEPGIELGDAGPAGTDPGGPDSAGTDPAGRSEREVVRFHDLNLFFGGVQAVERRDGELIGAGDPRRGGVAVVA
jgi:gamma-glutamyltranspeptidase/glutathione hydrolase